MTDFAELQCTTNYSFLKGASHPEELVETADKLNYKAIAITDECSLAGIVKAHVAAKNLNIDLIVGSFFKLDSGLSFVLLAQSKSGYGQLGQLISKGRRQATKGDYLLTLSDVLKVIKNDCLCIITPHGEMPLFFESYADDIKLLKKSFFQRIWIGYSGFQLENDKARLQQTKNWTLENQIPVVALNDVHMHCRERLPLQHILTAIRLGQPVNELGFDLFQNAERSLRPLHLLKKIYPDALLEQSAIIANLCDFSLDELRYQYPKELVPEGLTPTKYLRQLTFDGAKKRWPNRIPTKIKKLLVKELKIIQSLQYEPYFLTVYDLVNFARTQGILCQGRGSAANSSVCYCLFITEVDPDRLDLLFERFVSNERNEPPDIDVDFEHERREEVIQYIYQKYGRHRAALAAAVVTYRTKSAIRDVGKALGIALDVIEKIAKSAYHRPKEEWPICWEEKGLSLSHHLYAAWLGLTLQILGFPRHLSQHVGGFVIAEKTLTDLVPIENATMVDRTIIQWDKDDLEALGLLKVDVLSLGMLSAIRKSLAIIGDFKKQEFTLADVPKEDTATYQMLIEGDAIGTFQVESRAQLSMLPRLRPKCYYDLVVQVAIVRPGPIQGDMVHPYLARRNGEEAVTYPSNAVKKVLQRTLGVPIFQEQVMQLAMVCAGFTAGEADQLRRAMAAWKRRGGLEAFEIKLKKGMAERGYAPEFAQKIFQQIKGFAEYGFPESHAASFALLTYTSSWIKCHYPAVFTASLLNSLPMGFYAPAQLVQDAQRHGVEVLPVDVSVSDYDCTVPTINQIRLGFCMVKSLSKEGAIRIVNARAKSEFKNSQELSTRAKLDKGDLEALANANALSSISGHRFKAHWEVNGIEPTDFMFDAKDFAEASPMLSPPSLIENVQHDYNSYRLSLHAHPLKLLRDDLELKGYTNSQSIMGYRQGGIAKIAGLVTCRQRPSTAKGTTFVTIEDEFGCCNVIVWPKTVKAQRSVLIGAGLLGVKGIIERKNDVLYIVAGQLYDFSHWLAELKTTSRDFH